MGCSPLAQRCRSADFPVRSNVRLATGPGTHATSNRVWGSLRTGKSALRPYRSITISAARGVIQKAEPRHVGCYHGLVSGDGGAGAANEFFKLPVAAAAGLTSQNEIEARDEGNDLSAA